MPAVLPATGGSPAVNVHFTPFIHSLGKARKSGWLVWFQNRVGSLKVGPHENQFEIGQNDSTYRDFCSKKVVGHSLTKLLSAIYRGNKHSHLILIYDIYDICISVHLVGAHLVS